MSRTPELPPGLGPAFSVRSARTSGARRAAIDAAHLGRPFRGVRQRPQPAPAPSDPYERRRLESLARLRSLATVLPDHAFFVGPSAALLWKIPLPNVVAVPPRRSGKGAAGGAPGGSAQRSASGLARGSAPKSAGGPAQGLSAGPVHVGVCAPRTAPRRQGVTGRKLGAHLVSTTLVDGLPTTDAATTWASLGAHLDLEDLVAAADALLWIPTDPGGFNPWLRTDPVCTREQLQAVLERGQWRGASDLRDALALARTGAASRPETLLRLHLIRAGLPEPELNQDIYADDGRWLANADLVLRKHRVCIEYQGAQHRSASHYAADIDRRQWLAEAGWVMVEVPAAHLFRSPHEVVRRVLAAMQRP